MSCRSDALTRYLDTRYSKGTKSKEGARSGLLMNIKLLLTKIRSPYERRVASHLSTSSNPLKLHLGCGANYLDGWVNVDWARPGRQQDLNWDLRWSLPFADNSVDAIFTEHTLEHMRFNDGLRLLKECRRVLRPGRTLRISVPNLEFHVMKYLAHSEMAEHSGGPPAGLVLNELFYFYGHCALYDTDTLHTLLRAAGFASVAQSAFGEGSFQPSVDLVERREESIYAEATK